VKRAAVVALVLIASCSPTRHPPPATRHFKVGLLTPGSVNDNGWNAIAYEGLQRIDKDLGAEI
jgi:basic membrane protein A